MEIKIVAKDRCFHPKLNEVLPGTMVQYENHVYQKLNKAKFGEGLRVKLSKNYSLLLNPRYGSIRAVNSNKEVTILAQVRDVEVIKIKYKRDAFPYLRREGF